MLPIVTKDSFISNGYDITSSVSIVKTEKTSQRNLKMLDQETINIM